MKNNKISLVNKKTKGFTLVELIVVIAIIAILAAIAIPTSLHFVDKANISKEMQQMNASESIQAVFIDAKNNNIDLSETSVVESNRVTSKLEQIDLPYSYLGVIQISLTGSTDKWVVTMILKGQEYGDKTNGSVLSATLLPVFTDDELFSGSTKVPTSPSTFTYTIDKSDGSIVLVE